MIFARSGPTLTKVPVASLKSSAMRPSKRRPRWMFVRRRSTATASPVAEEAFFVEGLGRGVRTRASSRA
jgi:hypothetical protein